MRPDQAARAPIARALPTRRAFRANARLDRHATSTPSDPSSDPCPSAPNPRCAVAQDERPHVLTDIPEANDDIDAVAAFPAEPDVSAGFPSKAPLKILLGFRNNGDVPLANASLVAVLSGEG